MAKKSKNVPINAQTISAELREMAGRYGFEKPDSVVTPEHDDGFYYIKVSVEDPMNKHCRLCVKGLAKITSEKTISEVAAGLMTGLKDQIDCSIH